MKTNSSSRALILGSALVFALSIATGAQAQLEAPVGNANPNTQKPKKEGKGNKGDKKMQGKNLSPRAVTATETAMGKPLTPELKAQITTAFQARQAVIEAANEKYFADFAALTGLTVDQAREIDKPAKGGAGGKAGKAGDAGKPGQDGKNGKPGQDGQAPAMPANDATPNEQ